jgi:hypothetical protein
MAVIGSQAVEMPREAMSRGGRWRRLGRRSSAPLCGAQPKGRLLIAAAAVALGSCWWAAPTSARTLEGVACPTARQCTAIDNAGQEITFNSVSPGGRTSSTVDPGGFLAAIACPTRSQCTAVSASGQEVTFNPISPGHPQPLTIDGANGSTWIACPTSRQCTAVDSGGAEVTFNPRSPGHPKLITIDVTNDNYPSPIALDGIACASSIECVAVDQDGGELRFNPQRPPPSYNFYTSTGGGTITGGDDTGQALNGIACPSPSQCTAVDDTGNVVTSDPYKQASATNTAFDDTDNGNTFWWVACPSANECTVVDSAGVAVTFNPVSPPATPTLTQIDGEPNLTGLACASATQCTAVGGDVELTFNPASPGQPTSVAIDNGPTASGARATGFGKGHAQLSFTLTAAQGTPAISAFKVAPPAGIAFARSRNLLVRGIVVRADGTEVRSSTRLRHGQLAVGLATPADNVQITISRPAIIPSTVLANEIRSGKLRTIQLTVIATGTNLLTTQLIFNARVS